MISYFWHQGHDLLHLLSAHLFVNLSLGELEELAHLGDDGLGHVEKTVDDYVGLRGAVSAGW